MVVPAGVGVGVGGVEEGGCEPGVDGTSLGASEAVGVGVPGAASEGAGWPDGSWVTAGLLGLPRPPVEAEQAAMARTTAANRAGMVTGRALTERSSVRGSMWPQHRPPPCRPDRPAVTIRSRAA